MRDAGLIENALLDGRYRLVREIAGGAMGSVWQGVDIRCDRWVALKILRPELHSAPAVRRRFRREASILQALQHPAVVQVLDVGTDASERSYMVMELLRGETLEARLARESRLTSQQLAPLVEVIADGLFAAHEHGIIHGDVKPANVFLLDRPDAVESVKIVDFGLSKIEGLERLTRTGELTGTPAYMAPEVLTGAASLDARMDQYALGVVMYQALTGSLPFGGMKHPGALMMDIVRGAATPLRSLAPDVSDAIASVVERAMATQRDARFGDIREAALQFVRAARAS